MFTVCQSLLGAKLCHDDEWRRGSQTRFALFIVTITYTLIESSSSTHTAIQSHIHIFIHIDNIHIWAAKGRMTLITTRKICTYIYSHITRPIATPIASVLGRIVYLFNHMRQRPSQLKISFGGFCQFLFAIKTKCET